MVKSSEDDYCVMKQYPENKTVVIIDISQKRIFKIYSCNVLHINSNIDHTTCQHQLQGIPPVSFRGVILSLPITRDIIWRLCNNNVTTRIMF